MLQTESYNYNFQLKVPLIAIQQAEEAKRYNILVCYRENRRGGTASRRRRAAARGARRAAARGAARWRWTPPPAAAAGAPAAAGPPADTYGTFIQNVALYSFSRLLIRDRYKYGLF